MGEVATVATGCGVTFVIVTTYALWVVGRGKAIGRELGIGEQEELDLGSDSSTSANS